MPDQCIPTTTKETTESIPYGYCHCGCGQKTSIILKSRQATGLVSGEPRRYVQHHGVRRAAVPDVIIVDDHAEIPLRSKSLPGLFALIDIEDIDKVCNDIWYPRQARNTVYVNRQHHKKPFQLHRLILGLGTDDPDVDHVNGNGLDNRRFNIRVATHQQNMGNTKSRGGSSRFRGVHWSATEGVWVAMIRGEAKRKNLGQFVDEIAAAIAYDAAARERWGEFACLNFPKPGERSAVTGEVELEAA